MLPPLTPGTTARDSSSGSTCSSEKSGLNQGFSTRCYWHFRMSNCLLRGLFGVHCRRFSSNPNLYLLVKLVKSKDAWSLSISTTSPLMSFPQSLEILPLVFWDSEEPFCWEPLTETKSFLSYVKAETVITEVEGGSRGREKGRKSDVNMHVNIFLLIKNYECI